MVLIAAALAAHPFIYKGTPVVKMPTSKGGQTVEMPIFKPDASLATPHRGTPGGTDQGSPRRWGGRGL